MKRKGYILFESYNGKVATYDYSPNMKEFWIQYDNVIDDIWDMKGRNKVHYFYFDIEKGKYFPLPRWKKDYNPKLNFDQSDKKVLSTKMF